MFNFFKKDPEQQAVDAQAKRDEIAGAMARVEQLEQLLAEGPARRQALKEELRGYQAEYDELRAELRGKIRRV